MMLRHITLAAIWMAALPATGAVAAERLIVSLNVAGISWAENEFIADGRIVVKGAIIRAERSKAFPAEALIENGAAQSVISYASYGPMQGEMPVKAWQAQHLRRWLELALLDRTAAPRCPGPACPVEISGQLRFLSVVEGAVESRTAAVTTADFVIEGLAAE